MLSCESAEEEHEKVCLYSSSIQSSGAGLITLNRLYDHTTSSLCVFFTERVFRDSERLDSTAVVSFNFGISLCKRSLTSRVRTESSTARDRGKRGLLLGSLRGKHTELCTARLQPRVIKNQFQQFIAFSHTVLFSASFA